MLMNITTAQCTTNLRDICDFFDFLLEMFSILFDRLVNTARKRMQ